MRNYLRDKKNLPVVVLSCLLVVSIVSIIVLTGGGAVKEEDDQIKELQKTIKSISRLMILPENEQPTLATVSDASKLKDQPFFMKATTGDKVLIYPNSKKAILYSPSLDKIVEVSSLNLSPNNDK